MKAIRGLIDQFRVSDDTKRRSGDIQSAGRYALGGTGRRSRQGALALVKYRTLTEFRFSFQGTKAWSSTLMITLPASFTYASLEELAFA